MAELSPEQIELLAKRIAASDFCPQVAQGGGKYRKMTEADIFFIITAGQDLGFAPTLALRAITPLKGKLSMGADAIAAVVTRRRDVCEYLTLKELTDEKCTYVAKRSGAPAPVEYSFTLEDARKAGLVNDMYKKFPRPMLRARCISAICKAVFPDLAMGLYDSDTGELTDGKPVEAPPLLAEVPPPTPAIDKGPMGGAEVPPVEEGEKPADFLSAEPTEEDKLYVAIGECQNLEDLTRLLPRIRKLSAEAQDRLRPAYTQQSGALKKGAAR